MQSKRLKANFFASLSNKAIIALEQIILVPVYLNYWGVDYYGAWLVLAAIPTMLALSNFGVGSAALTRIVLALGRKDESEANSILVISSLLIFVVYGILISALLIFPNMFFDQNYLIEAPNVIIAILMASIGCIALAEPVCGFWVARDKAALSMFMRAGLGLLRVSVVMLLIVFGYDAYAVSIGGLIVSIVWLIAFFAMSVGNIRWKCSFRLSLILVKKLLFSGAGYQISSLWQAILFPGSIWLANAYLGPVGAATWGTLRALSRSGNQLLAIVNHSITPEFQNLIAKKYIKDARRLHAVSIVMSLFISLSAALLITFFGSLFYTWWTQGELEVGFWVWPVLSIGLVFNSIWMGSEIVHRAFNQPWRINILGVFASLVAIALMALSMNYYDSIEGFVFGALVFEVIMASYVLRRSLFLLQDDLYSCLQRGFIILRDAVIRRKVF